MSELSAREKECEVWAFFKPRHTHAWNMLVLSWQALDQPYDETEIGFQTEYFWENYLLRLWLYRTTVRTLTKLSSVEEEAKSILKVFDGNFETKGLNGLKALRDMIEHFDDYAAGKGRGPVTRENDLDPWRKVTRDRYERGQFILERKSSYEAAIVLRSQTKLVSNKFIQWFKSTE